MPVQPANVSMVLGTSSTIPTLDTDLADATGTTTKRICIATPEIPDRNGSNGGLDARGRHLARLLAARGHDVLIACVTGDAADEDRVAEIRGDYARLGVTVEAVVPRDTGKSPMRRITAPTWELLDWLRAREEPFDILHVVDRDALGYGPLLAKSLGQAFGSTHIVVSATAPTLWTIESNRQLVSTEEELGRVFIEQRSVELADTVISSSEHLLAWMREAGYTLPVRTFVWPNALSASDRTLDVWTRWHGQTAPFDATAQRFAARTQAAGADTPLVSVCVVHHERPALLRMAVDSVLAQDYPALETVLVDDGSRSAEARAALDELEALLARRSGRVIRQENRYLGAARNRAAAAARGEWLVFLDDDDLLSPDAVSRLVRASRFAEADCVAATSVDFSGDGDPRTHPAACGPPIRHPGPARAWNRMRNVIGGACALMRRDVFLAVGGFTEVHGVGLEDLELYNRLILTGRRIAPLPDPVHYYRRHRTTSMMGLMDDRRQAETGRARALKPHLERQPAQERAYRSYAVALHTARTRLSKDLYATRRTLAARDRWIESLTGRLDAARRTSATRQARIDALTETVRHRDRRIETMLASTSWRLTAPLRWIGSWLGNRDRQRHAP